jgi:hypothetical protein
VLRSIESDGGSVGAGLRSKKRVREAFHNFDKLLPVQKASSRTDNCPQEIQGYLFEQAAGEPRDSDVISSSIVL